MKSYLSLVPISAKVRKRQNRMTILCVIISIFLVTAIFSVADMMIRTQSDRMTGKNGSWHIELDGISQETALKIAERDDVVSIGAVTIFNPDGELPYRMDGKRVVLYGIDQSYLTMNSTGAAEGRFPQGMGEIMLSSNAARVLQVAVGDTVTLRTPSGDWDFTVSGLGGVEESYYSGQYSLMDAYLPRTAFAALMEQNNVHNLQTSYYVQFTSASKAAKAIPELTAQHNLPENAVSENTGVMAIAGHSDSSAAKNVYSLAAVLFVLVLLAGVLMISGSMNSNLAQRTQFFGMMRCIGMSKRQVIRFVRLEALNWCRTAVPIGLVLGTLASWTICAALRYGIGGEFAATPVWQLSPAGLCAGAVVGVVTVLLAAQAPAKRAAKVSPMAAVSGSTQNVPVGRAAHAGKGRVELALGVRHATASKKNWALMTASFALSIVLALGFTVLLQFASLLLPSLVPWQPDVLYNGYGNAQVLPGSMTRTLLEVPGVAHAWGCTGLVDTPASSDKGNVDHVIFCSYDDYMLESSRSVVVRGRMPGAGNEVMTIYNKNNPMQIGDVITVNGVPLTIVGAFSEGTFPDDVTLIAPEALLRQVAGDQNYNMVGVQLDRTADEDTLFTLADLATDDVIMQDLRESNRQDRGTYYAVRIVLYGFLAIIGGISLLNIVNSISMSVSARARQYGAMRAVGMEDVQLCRMIAAEAGTYAASGLLVGVAAGLVLHRALYTRLITHYFGVMWRVPFGLLAVLCLFVAGAAALAVHGPVKRLQAMPVTAAINEL